MVKSSLFFLLFEPAQEATPAQPRAKAPARPFLTELDEPLRRGRQERARALARLFRR